MHARLVSFLLLSFLINCCATTWPYLHVLTPKESSNDQETAVKDLLNRLLKERANEFEVSIDPNLGPADRDTYRLENKGQEQKIAVTGNTGVAASLGIQNYLKYWAGCHISWSGSQLNLPTPLPRIDTPIQMSTNDRFRYYQNVCTVSYSSVWWNWKRWEQEIDWMALNGINLPLAFTGQEAIWTRVYKKFNFTSDDLDNFFSGPAFLAWQRMGNLDQWAGPLPVSWQEQQLNLQHQILARMRSFGMVPVLPAFSGHVPPAIVQHYPHANVSQMSWGQKFNNTFLLSPEDPLFQDIGNTFIGELIGEFGTNHIYNCDVFNEMEPQSGDLNYLRRVGNATFSAMTSADSKAIWLMQGWLFNSVFWLPERAEALLTSVPIGKMIVLDLQAELYPLHTKLDSFYGQPFIWCMLHNFGGVLGMYGVVENVNTLPFQSRVFPNSTMIGLGLTMEGINQNDVMYELMNEMTWRNESVDLQQWFTHYGYRRYGSKDPKIGIAWRKLLKSVYNCTDGHKQHGAYVVVKRPSLRLIPSMWYQEEDLLDAWDNLLEIGNNISCNETYQYDLVDVTREVLQTLSNQFYQQLVDSFKAKNKTGVLLAGNKIIEILQTLEELLASDGHFLLGRWLQDAKDNGISELDKVNFEYNARNQVTLWGPHGNIRDYAAKQWSGLMKSYYLPRWQLFQRMLMDCIMSKKPFKINEFYEKAFTEIEEPFTFDRNEYPTVPVGDTVEIVKEIHLKWRHQRDTHILIRK
uniref:Alpha-N-acetylglucosaminidase n=1 Tax=Strigamia maritima TaxID=126957 RepID=T1JFM2_STRMM